MKVHRKLGAILIDAPFSKSTTNIPSVAEGISLEESLGTRHIGSLGLKLLRLMKTATITLS
jgi:hypothetical protein